MARRFRLARGGVLAVLCVAVTAAPASTAVPAGQSWTALVVNAQSTSNSVTPIKTSTDVPGGQIGVGSLPLGIAITPDARTAYVVNLGATPNTGSLTPVDLTTSPPSARAAISLAGHVPNFIAISPDGGKAYVSDPQNGQVVPIDLRGTQPVVGTPFNAGTGPEGIAFTPDGRKAYVADLRGNAVVPVTVATDTPGAPIQLPASHGPFAVAVTPDGSKAYVTDLNAAAVTPIDVATDTPGADIAVGTRPQGIAIAPDGATAYVTGGGSGTVTPVAVATDTPGPGIAVGDSPYAIAITPDGRKAYVTNGGVGDNTVVPVDLTTSPPAPGTGVRVGNVPRGIAITPDQAPVAGFSVSSAPRGKASTFDASSSTLAFGTIASYTWSFGDGSPPVTTTTPTVTHVYAAGGAYAATLTETTAAGTSAAGQVFTGQTASRVGGAGARAGHTVVITSVPSPVAGVRMSAETVSGTVLVRLPGSSKFVPLGPGRQLPVGTIVDARRGRVRITATSGGKTYSADFYEGLFQIAQKRRRGATADMRLFGGDFRRCPAGLRSPKSLGSKGRHSIRHLWGDGSGPFRTVGRYSAASIRGTQWLTDDQCTGTLTKVTKGSVSVRDFVRHKTLIVRAGRSYFAAGRR